MIPSRHNDSDPEITLAGAELPHSAIGIGSGSDSKEKGADRVFIVLEYENNPIFIVMRSQKAVDEVIAALNKNKLFVWPASGN